MKTKFFNKNHCALFAFVTIIWMAAGLLSALYEYFFLSNYPGVFITDPMQEYDLARNIIAAVGGLFVGAILFCTLELFYFQRKIKRERFWVALLKKAIIYTIFLIGLIILISLFYNSFLSDRSIFSSQAWNKTITFITSEAIIHPIIPILLLAVLTIFFIQISERFGSSELWKMFTGKYFNPVEEPRIFMFLDLNASTSIAERLGNEKFYDYLNDFFHDIANVINRFKGDVVEYVGDLVVITWPLPIGIAEERCLACFSEFEKTIAKREDHYLENYDIVPTFKAAVHCGNVIIGEMGKIKKTIRYSGDVLNTTARVEKMCGTIGAKMLITDNLFRALPNGNLVKEKIGNIQLRGKELAVDLYEVKL